MEETRIRRKEDYPDLAARFTSSSLMVFRPACIASLFASLTRSAMYSSVFTNRAAAASLPTRSAPFCFASLIIAAIGKSTTLIALNQ